MLLQKRFLQTLSLKPDATGIYIIHKKLLGTKKEFISYHDLGIDLTEHTDRQGLPTLIMLGFMTFPMIYSMIIQLQRGSFLGLFFGCGTMVFLMVIIYSYQEYFKKTYQLTGGNKSLELFRGLSCEQETRAFIALVNANVIRASILRYNSLITHFTEIPEVIFAAIPENQQMDEEAYRLLQAKINMFPNLLSNYLPVKEEDQEEEAEEPW